MVVTDRFVSWYEARDFCEEKQTYLADMPDTTERETVWKYAKGIFRTQRTLSQHEARFAVLPLQFGLSVEKAN